MESFFKSVEYAMKGIRTVFSERNFIIQIFVALVVVILMGVLRTSHIENAILVVCIGVVLAAEMMNSAVEKLSDFVSPSHHDQIGLIKDLMAGGVLILSLTALIVGIIIFGNRLFLLWPLFIH